MTKDTIIARNPDDGRRYKVKERGHWSTIVNVADENEVHHVKWYGGCPRSKQELYVSHPDGIGFISIANP